jgi:rubrerythrin
MEKRFSADDVFAIAEQIEVNGGEFYRKAADIVKDPAAKEMMLKLAAMEDDHKRFFAGLREQLKRPDGEPWEIDPDGEATRYLKAFAEGHVFSFHRDAASRAEKLSSVEEIIYTAIGFEKDAIVFFLGIKNFVPKWLGKNEVDRLIKEEQRHIVILSNELKHRHRRTTRPAGDGTQ